MCVGCDHQSASNQLTPKEMEVCHICGAFLVVGDIPQRVEEHVSGKQHMGYAKVRDTIENLKVRLDLNYMKFTYLSYLNNS